MKVITRKMPIPPSFFQDLKNGLQETTKKPVGGFSGVPSKILRDLFTLCVLKTLVLCRGVFAPTGPSKPPRLFSSGGGGAHGRPVFHLLLGLWFFGPNVATNGSFFCGAVFFFGHGASNQRKTCSSLKYLKRISCSVFQLSLIPRTSEQFLGIS